MAQTGVNVKMGVSGVSQFKQDINTVKESMKTLDKQLELVEKQYKATGDKEAYMREKAELLHTKLEQQKTIVKDAEAALKSMNENGVSKASRAYQAMQRELLSAKGSMIDTQTQIEGLGSAAQSAGTDAENLNTDLKNIGKGVGWQSVTTGIKDIADQLENAAKAAINLGKRILESAKGSTGFADEVKTIVDQYSDMGLTAKSYQQMRNVERFVDTPVEAILTAKQRMQKALTTDKGKETLEETLGINLGSQNAEDLFWEIGDALMGMGEAFDKEGAAQTMFGRSWRELLPLFKTGREEYNKMLEEQNVLTDEQIEKLGKADDTIQKFELEIENLKNKFWAENADKITELLNWLIDNEDKVVATLGAIAAAFAAIKIGEFALNLQKVIHGFGLIAGGGGGTSAASAASSATASGGTKAGLATVAKNALATSPLWAPFVLGAMDTHREAEEFRKVEAQLKEYSEEGAEFAKSHEGQAGMDAWQALYAYTHTTGELKTGAAGGAFELMDEFSKSWHDWLDNDAENEFFDSLIERMSLEEYDAMIDAMNKWDKGGGFESDEEEEAYFGTLRRALELIEEEMNENRGDADNSTSEMAEAAKGMKGIPDKTAAAVKQALNGTRVVINGSELSAVVGQVMAGIIAQYETI